MLKGVINSSTGTATTAKISGVYQAGKTGTDNYASQYKNKVPSDAVVDSWMAGYTKNYSVAVWTGYDKSTRSWWLSRYLQRKDFTTNLSCHDELPSTVFTKL